MAKSRRNGIALLCGSVAVVLVLLLAAGCWVLFSNTRSYELRLPDFEDLKGVTLAQKGGDETQLVDAYAEDVLLILKGNGRTTRVESIQDAPVNVADWIKVDFCFTGGGTSTLFVYHNPESQNGEYFIEQPYNGIYAISGDEYNSIMKYVKGEGQNEGNAVECQLKN